MILPRRCWKCLVKGGIFLSLAAVTIIFLYNWLLSSKMCSLSDSKRFLRDLCFSYSNGFIEGSLCENLCQPSRILFKDCLNYRHGKVILLMEQPGLQFILKTKEIHSENFKTLSFVLGGDMYPEFIGFKQMVFNELKSHITKSQFLKEDSIPSKSENPLINSKYGHLSGHFDKQTILDDFIGFPIEEYRLHRRTLPRSEDKEKAAMMDSIWSLVQQPEYIFMQINQNWKFVPKIYGTCGKFYAMEYLISGVNLESHLWADFSKRIQFSIQLLELVTDMDNWKPSALHMCDVKLENFALSSAGQLYTIDVDMFFFDDQMQEIIMATSNCSSHGDCDFFDCKGFCDRSTGKCLNKRLNNNLQAVCEKIFSSVVSNGFSGLLDSLPTKIQPKFSNVLKSCIQPENSHDRYIPGKASKSVGLEILSMLKEALTMDL